MPPVLGDANAGIRAGLTLGLTLPFVRWCRQRRARSFTGVSLTLLGTPPDSALHCEALGLDAGLPRATANAPEVSAL